MTIKNNQLFYGKGSQINGGKRLMQRKSAIVFCTEPYLDTQALQSAVLMRKHDCLGYKMPSPEPRPLEVYA